MENNKEIKKLVEKIGRDIKPEKDDIKITSQYVKKRSME